MSQLRMYKFRPDNQYKILYFYATRALDDLYCHDQQIQLRGTQVSFDGKVGEDSRSVRSITPFPKVLPVLRDVCHFSLFTNSVFCRQLEEHNTTISNGYFSCPYVGKDSLINVGIRSIAYYEVEIEKRFDRARSSNVGVNLDDLNNSDTRENDVLIQGDAINDEFTDNLLPEVIAIGLSSSNFSADYRLPGWDFESYGYHGDDGMIYHGHGRQIAEFGPKFGIGDIVGCGIRYDSRSVFFTLNGKYLGDAFTISAGEWYPTVGIDSRANITFNFTGPFKFDINQAVPNTAVSYT